MCQPFGHLFLKSTYYYRDLIFFNLRHQQLNFICPANLEVKQNMPLTEVCFCMPAQSLEMVQFFYELS